MNNVSILRQIDFFVDSSDADLENILPLFQEIPYEENAVIFREGDQGDSFYIVKKGRVEITKSVLEHTDTQVELKVFGPHEYFGEMALIDKNPRSATARAVTPCVLFRINKEDFADLCLNYPSVLSNLIRSMSLRIRATNEQFATLFQSLLSRSSLAAVGASASKIVHDIKTPLSSIVVNAEAIKSHFPDAQAQVSRITRQTQLIDEMVREILEFAKGEPGEIEVKETDLDAFFQDLAETLGPIVEQKGSKLEIPGRSNAVVRFDARKINRVLMNMVRNAMEAMAGPGTIGIEAEVRPKGLHLSVWDTGPGIPPELLERIFEPFVSKGKATGTGLGLAMCWKMISEHGGTVAASNPHRGGARFDIHIPLK
jgi:signal transduction histidine kinase